VSSVARDPAVQAAAVHVLEAANRDISSLDLLGAAAPAPAHAPAQAPGPAHAHARASARAPAPLQVWYCSVFQQPAALHDVWAL
jgi:hypothetical protein